jgi:hypothetical protein
MARIQVTHPNDGIDPFIGPDTLLFMISRMARQGTIAAVSFLLLTAGCGKSEDAAKAVDVTAQVAQLKGGTDAQANALSELAAGGPKSASAVKDIIPLLKSDDTVIRRLAAYALCQIGPAAKAAVPDLKALMQDPDTSTATTAINALNAIDPSASEGIKVLNVTQ